MPDSHIKDMNEIQDIKFGQITLKLIPGIIPAYRAGSNGSIYSSKRYRTRKGKWKLVRGNKNKKSSPYFVAWISNGPVAKRYSVHRLICSAFHGLPPSDYMHALHKDGNPINNHPSNLAWGTPRENWLDKKLHGLPSISKKNWKLSPREREHLHWAIKNNLCSRKYAAKILSLGLSHVSRIADGRFFRWKEKKI